MHNRERKGVQVCHRSECSPTQCSLVGVFLDVIIKQLKVDHCPNEVLGI